MQALRRHDDERFRRNAYRRDIRFDVEYELSRPGEQEHEFIVVSMRPRAVFTDRDMPDIGDAVAIEMTRGSRIGFHQALPLRDGTLAARADGRERNAVDGVLAVEAQYNAWRRAMRGAGEARRHQAAG
ncbi:hypothetical protein PanNE5_00810 [Pandoraea sp. NE5]|nr:hypothetical protein PanNE5_00810 [Pandoraea sp. NE5]